jgi:hypothetical protein
MVCLTHKIPDRLGGGAATIEAAVAAAKFDSPKEQAIRAVLKQIRELSQ